ncbi:NAD(P)/FAD-dependent oxidoreductase [Streptomyces sp. NPDC059349]|uniref:NAD(P)/FAD-dependent oxidoreductase n=1 Tax=Streptomyces sp. NPDC059349 TaxID=3346808 RepID=UPI00367BD3E9
MTRAAQGIRTAVVGSGVAGLTAAHILARRHDVVMYEGDDRTGGHAHTHDVPSADGRVHQVDSGFIVHNRRTYPNLLRLFSELGVTTQASEMSMSVRCEGCGLEYAGARGPSGLFAQARNVTRGRYLRMLAEVPVFHRAARRLLAEVLGAFRYSRNSTVLHTDTGVLPRGARARAAWNYLMPTCGVAADRVRVSYDMNRLQRLTAPETFVVTLGGEDRVDPGRVLARMTYEHPVLTPESVAAQQRLPGLGGPRTAYAGAYHGWGFHEDGCRSGAAAAAALGVVW